MNTGKRHLVASVLRTVEEVESEVAGVMTGTAADIQQRSGVANCNVLRHLKAMNIAQEAHIHSWVRPTTNWIPRWVAGPGENAPAIRLDPAECRARILANQKERRLRLKLEKESMQVMTPSRALKLTDEFIARVKQTRATWYSPLNM